MVRLIILDDTTVTVSGGSVIGPGTLDVETATVDAVEYAHGTVVVRAGDATKTTPMHPSHILALPYALSAFILCGMVCGWALGRRGILGIFACLLAAAPAEAWEGHRIAQAVTNPAASSRSYRASIYEAVVAGGDPIWTVPGAAYSRSINGGDQNYNVRLAVRNTSGVWLWANDETAHFKPSSAGFTLNHTTPDVVYSSAAINNATWCFKYDWQAWPTPGSAATNSAWGLTGTSRYVTPVEGESDEVMTRGGLVTSWDFELAAGSSMTVDVAQAFPFFLVIEELKQIPTADGGFSYAYEEIDEYTSTEHTTAGSTPPPPVLEPTDPDFQPEEPEPTPRPHETADTLDKLDKNQEARTTDEINVAKQQRDLLAQQAAMQAAGFADLKSALSGQGAGDGQGLGEGADEQSEAIADAQETATERAETIGEALGDLQATVLALGEKFSFSVTGSSYPTLRVPLPAALGAGPFYEFDFSQYASTWSLLRYILLLVIGWYALQNILAMIRSALV